MSKEELLNELKVLTDEPKLITLMNDSKKLGIGLKTLRKLSREKDFPCIQFGNKKMVVTKELDGWLQSHLGECFD